MLNNKTFYPTPETLIAKMVSKIKREPFKILEPSAGKGDIVNYLKQYYYDRRYDISVIEIDPKLQAILRDNREKLIDSDFLEYSGPDKFDLIIANPPFDEGDKHLLKAIDIMYNGEIIFLLNAETIKNPYTNTRKELIRKLNELNAEIEYIPDAFKDAERPTGVEVALIYINIERDIEDDLFAGCNDKSESINPEIEKNYEVSTGKNIEELVAEYNQIVNIGIETIMGYYKNYKKIGKYIGLNEEVKRYSETDKNITHLVSKQINDMLSAVRTDFWRRTLDLKEVRNRLTAKKRNEFETLITRHCDMDFTERNIRQFILNLMGSFEQTLIDAVVEVFNRFTIKHCYSGELYDENIHYFTGWKTNKAFKVNKKVIIPIYGRACDSAFFDWGRWKLAWDARDSLNDIDIVMNYFDGMKGSYLSIAEAIEDAFSRGQSSKIESTYFIITCYKKGTIHLTFKDDDILRRFNIAACKGKGFLPHEYGTKAYSDMNEEEQIIVNSFEGKESYVRNLNQPLFGTTSMLRIAA